MADLAVVKELFNVRDRALFNVEPAGRETAAVVEVEEAKAARGVRVDEGADTTVERRAQLLCLDLYKCLCAVVWDENVAWPSPKLAWSQERVRTV